MSFVFSYKHTNCSNIYHTDKHQLIRADRKSIAPQPYSAIKFCSVAKHKTHIRYIFNLNNLITAGEINYYSFQSICPTFSVWMHLNIRKIQFLLFLFCRNTLPKVLRLLWGLPHRLLWLPAVLHRQAKLSLHLLLQHPALQRAQEEASHPFGSDVQPADEPATSPLPDLLPAAAGTLPCDVNWRSHHIAHCTVCFLQSKP